MVYTWWQVTIFVIGVFATIAAIVALFLPIGGATRKTSISSPMPKVGSDEFLETVANSLTAPILRGKHIEILNNGDQFLPALLADIAHAKSSINMMLYIWEKGEMSDQILRHLQAKAKAGVAVRVILDAVGAIKAPRQEFEELKDSGATVVKYHSLSIAPWNFVHNHKRTHRRSIVIDGTIGYTGGIAVADKWLGDARTKDQWRDVMFRMQGAMVRNIQGAFAELWASITGEILVGPQYYPLVPADSTLTYIPLSSTPAPDVLLLQKMLLCSLYGATEKAYMTTPYFLPDDGICNVLTAKAQQGVDVRILVPGKETDTPMVRFASHHNYESLLKAGVRIYEYQTTFIHAKYMVINSIWSVIGSANLDNRSRKINEENIYGIHDVSFGGEIEAMFQHDIERATEISLAAWQKRSIWHRIREVFALILIKQF